MNKYTIKTYLISSFCIIYTQSFAQKEPFFDYFKTQFAGGMGLISAGTGIEYGKNKQWETDLMVGFVPKFSTEKNKITYTLKQNYIPWKKELSSKVTLEPLSTGLYVNSILGEEYWVKNPEKYPSNKYYTFSTKLRFYIFAGQRIQLKNAKKGAFTLFYEVSTNDLYLVSGLGNESLKPSDFIKLSFGLKIQ